MLADRLGRCETGSGDKPYTLQVSPGVTADSEAQAHLAAQCISLVVALLPTLVAVGAAEWRMVRRTTRRKYSDVGAVARGLKQREPERILLSPEQAPDQPLIILRHPITPPVLGNYEMVRRRNFLRRKVRHAHTANPAIPAAHRRWECL